MRVPDKLVLASLNRSQAQSSQSLYKAARVASSGLKVEAPADGPHAFARITNLKSAEARLAARESGLSRAEGDLSIGESTLAQASDVLARARELAVQMADGTYNAADRAAAAKEVTQLRQALVGLANTKGPNGYLFGGTRTDTPPFDANGVFSGNDGAVSVEIADGMTLRQNPSGAQAFTAAGGRDVFADLRALETALATNDVAAVQASTGQLDTARTQVVGARGAIGLGLQRVRSAADIASQARFEATKARAAESDADAVGAYRDLASAQSAFSRSVEITQSILSTLGKSGR